ncbi:MAG: modification methylase, partial [Rhizobiaceae bacterium]
AEPRVAFGSLIESGLLLPGTKLFDSKRRWDPVVRLDGSLEWSSKTGSIHKMGAIVQELDACNGWTFWHYESEGKLCQIDELRKKYRTEVMVAGA